MATSRPVYHIDLYRLDEAAPSGEPRPRRLFASGALVLLEWAERFPSLLPRQRTEIRLRALADEIREITVSRLGYSSSLSD